MPTFDVGSVPRFDAFAGGAARFEGFEVDAVGFDSVASAAGRVDRLVGNAWRHSAEGWVSTHNSARNDELDSVVSTLNPGQRGWLAKGLRDWTNYVAKATNWLAIEVDRSLDVGLFDLKTFLYRRQLRGMERGARWARWSKGAVRAWLRRLGDRLLDRLAERLRSDNRPRVLLALLKAPPGWAAARFRLDFQAGLPRMLERLSEVQAPNAPSLPSGHLTAPGGNVA